MISSFGHKYDDLAEDEIKTLRGKKKDEAEHCAM